MKKIISIFLSIIMMITISACTNTSIDTPSPQQNELVYTNLDEMPEPFDTLTGGGAILMMRFSSPTHDDNPSRTIDAIDHSYVTPFIALEIFHEWVYGFQEKDYLSRPAQNLSCYPNLYSFILNFDIPVDELKKILEENQRFLSEWEIDSFTDEEINAIVSLDEVRILEHFVSDYSIFHDGRVFSPAWLYWHTPDDYERAGITSEMIEEKLDLYAEFNFTAEAAEAFELKLSEFIGNDVTFDRILDTDNY
jgi:hypothetical protein